MDNKDLSAQTDAELGHTDTVRMKLDTVEHPPIKMKQYRTPLNKRAVIDNAMDEMLEAGDHSEITITVEISSSGGRQKGWVKALLCRFSAVE